jgi:hypothetical protein
MYYTIYKITNIMNNKIYIGRHKTMDLDDGYMGSGTRICAAIKKYGVDNFLKEIILQCDNYNDMILRESEMVNSEFVKCDSNYNVIPGGDGFNTTGMVSAILVETGENVFIRSEDYQKNKNKYTTASSGFVTVWCDINEKYHRITTSEFDGDIHRAIAKGRTSVWNSEKNRFHKIPSSDYDRHIHRTPSDGFVRARRIGEPQFRSVPCHEYKENKTQFETPSSGKRSVKHKVTGETSSIGVHEFDQFIHESVFGGIVAMKNGVRQYVTADEYYNDNSMKVTASGNVTAYDTIENRIRHVPSEEYRRNKSRYLANGSGTVTVIDKKSKEQLTITTEEFHKNKDLYNTPSTGKRTVWLITDKVFKNILKEDFDRKYHAYASDKHLICTDASGEVIFDYFGSKRDFCDLYPESLYNAAKKSTKMWKPYTRDKRLEMFNGCNFENRKWR